MHFVADRVKIDTLKKGEDPDAHYNRPLIPEHVRAITSYLTDQDQYILPPLTLCVEDEISVYVPRSNSAVKAGVAVLPQSTKFIVTDGQHRIRGIQDAISKGPERLREDGIAVTIVSERDIEKVHQDFVDCAQTKAISPALLTAFNVRDPLSKLVRRIADSFPVFKDRIEKVGNTVGKNSVKLFTMNQLRAGIAEMLTGNSIQSGAKVRQDAAERLCDDEAMEKWYQKVFEAYRLFAVSNPEWNDLFLITDRAAYDQVNTKDLREKYLTFTATGMVIIGRVIHSIHQQSVTRDASFVSEKIRELAELDWSRTSEMWQGNVMTLDGKVATQNAPVSTAVINVKLAIDLELTESERKRLDRQSGQPELEITD